MRRRVLILCTGNSCRSQMAEGWVRALKGEAWEARSAGTSPSPEVHPFAIRAMDEVGVDIQDARPESVDAYVDQEWDLVVTVCDSARETCPHFPMPVRTVHVSFPDPAYAEGSDAERMEVFRSVRDDIKKRLLPLLE